MKKIGRQAVMSRWREYNPNPIRGKRVGDCTVRALSKALGKDWESVYAELSAVGFELCDMPSANHVWGAYLRRNGFRRQVVDDGGRDVYIIRLFGGVVRMRSLRSFWALMKRKIPGRRFVSPRYFYG